jgi:hypothetical protein
VFDCSTKAKARSSYRLLILDGHGSHLTKDFIDYCDQNRILLMIYPPHLTHTLQPLDVVMFKPLASAYSGQVAAFMERCQGLTSMSKRDFYPMSMTAWEVSFKEDTILKAFEATGVSPFAPEVILKRFNKQPTPGSLSASNRRKTESLIRQVVKDRADPQAQKLSWVFHWISVQKSLLEHEAQGLRQALTNERLRRKQGKALPLEQPEEDHGGAVFWSPRKVKEARDRQQQQEQEEEQQRLQKAKRGHVREDQKQAKLQAVQQRRTARAAARVVREKEKAEQASRAAARRTHQWLQQAFKTARWVRREASRRLLRQAQKREQLRSLRMVKTP